MKSLKIFRFSLRSYSEVSDFFKKEFLKKPRDYPVGEIWSSLIEGMFLYFWGSNCNIHFLKLDVHFEISLYSVLALIIYKLILFYSSKLYFYPFIYNPKNKINSKNIKNVFSRKKIAKLLRYVFTYNVMVKSTKILFRKVKNFGNFLRIMKFDWWFALNKLYQCSS